MLPASNRGAGQTLCFPDVCNTPVGPATVPIPYPNIGMKMQAVPFSVTTKVSMMNALNLMSSIPMTMGDNAGVAHPTFMGAARFTMGNPIVFVDKLPAINLTSLCNGNNMNAPVGSVLVPSAVNVFYTLASEGPAADWLCEVRARLERLAGAEVSASLSEDGVLALRIGAFPADVVRRVQATLAGLDLGAVRSIALDLRGNPGGELSAAIDLASEFLPAGSVVARVVDADGDEEPLSTSRPPRFVAPVVIFVDGGTASAAEIFAAGLRHAGRATLVGEPTYGKRVATGLVASDDGAVVGHLLSWVGEGSEPIVPDAPVPPAAG